MPQVDVLVPAYNAGRYLAAALDSVEAQTFPDWRIVLVDDGSTDNTEAVAKTYAARLGDRFLYIFQPNKGLAAARNTGIRSSDAEFIALLDSDDVWLPNRLEESLHSLEGRPQAGLSYGFVSCIDTEGRVLSTHTDLYPEAEGRIAQSIYTRRIDLPCPTITFRRSSLEGIGVFDETMRATEDRDLWLRIAQRFEVVRIPRVIALYRRSSGSMTSDAHRMFTAQMQFLQKHAGSPGCDSQARRIAESSIYRQKAETLGLQGKTPQALASVARAIWLNPINQKNVRTAASVLWHGFRRS